MDTLGNGCQILAAFIEIMRIIDQTVDPFGIPYSTF